MAQRQTRKTHALRLTFTRHHKRRLARIVTRGVQSDFVRQALNGFQQTLHLGAGLAVVQRGDQADRLAQQGQVLLKLGFEGVVEHGVLRFRGEVFERSTRPLVASMC